jgi:hypothetical protein
MPGDIKALLARTGTKGFHWPVIICAEENTRAFADALATLVIVANQEDVEFASLKRVVLTFFSTNLAVMKNWYALTDCALTVEAVEPAVQRAESRSALTRLLGELTIYIGRVHWWADTLVPWDEMSKYYEQQLLSPVQSVEVGTK